jgi:hypothetical protein
LTARLWPSQSRDGVREGEEVDLVADRGLMRRPLGGEKKVKIRIKESERRRG